MASGSAAAAAANSSCDRLPTAGCVIAFSAARFSGDAKMMAPSAARSRLPSAAMTLGAELLGDRGEGRGAGFDDLAGDPVGVDHHRAVLGEAGGDHATCPDAIPPVRPISCIRC